MTKNSIVILVIVVLLLTALISFIGINLGLRLSLDKREQEFEKKVEVEQKKIREDLEEKYQADMVSYEAMAKRLALEKERSTKMQDNIKDLKKEVYDQKKVLKKLDKRKRK